MAASFTLGQNFAVLLTIDGVDAELVCKTASTITFTNTPVKVRNRCTGDYEVSLPGGQKAGSIDFTGDYNKTPTAPNISAFTLASLLGNVYTAIWGGTDSGDEIVTVDIQINNVSITSDDNTQVSFSATLDFAGTPVVGVKST